MEQSKPFHNLFKTKTMNAKLTKYPDGTSYVNKVGLAAKPIRINSYEELWHLNQYVDAFISQHNIKPNILIPNLLDAQADKRFNIGESSGLMLVLRFLKSLPVKKYYIFHPHNPEVVEAVLKNRVEIIDNSEFIETVIHRLDDTSKSDPNLTFKEFGKDVIGSKIVNNLILMSSDAGGFKPLAKLCDKLKWQGEMHSCVKARSWSQEDGSKFIQEIGRDDFEGKDVLIIDDICVYGGTFKGLSKLLKERNVGKLYLAVSHITIQTHKGDDTVFNYFDTIFTTNSKFDTYVIGSPDGAISNLVHNAIRPKNLQIIKLFDYETIQEGQ